MTAPGPRAKKTYTITESGRAALAEWLPEPPAFQPRSEMVLKAYAVNSADPTRMAEMYQAIADQAAERLEAWRAELKTMAEQGYSAPSHSRFGNYACSRWAWSLSASRMTGPPGWRPNFAK
ncbi:MAG TPA: PadR family transcriptional regulator [Candidatus Limnocylindrales bacterium]|nr:PadR family transcriptional regulator [Candidatus Limnocylindrales bacterium]